MNPLVERVDLLAQYWWDYVVELSWQFHLCAAVALGVAVLGRRLSSPLRYGLLCLALVKLAVPTMVTSPSAVWTYAPTVVGESSPSPTPALLGGVHEPFVAPFPPSMKSSASSEESNIPATPPQIAAEEVAIPPIEAPREPVKLPSLLSWMMLLHILGSVGLGFWMLCQSRHLRGIRRRSTSVDPGLQARLRHLEDHLRIRWRSSLRMTAEIDVPVACGLIRREILMPSTLIEGLSDEEIDSVLLHESAHHARLDLWMNWFQILMTCVWWFQPFLHVLNRSIRKTREDCCDDLLLGRRLLERGSYCQALLKVASRVTEKRFSMGGALGFADRLHPLGKRLIRIMDAGRRRATRLSFLSGAILALLGGLWLPGASESQEQDSEGADANRVAIDRSPEKIQEWLDTFSDNDFFRSQEAKRALIAIGEPSVGPLLSLIRERRPEAGMAVQTLASMGSAAKAAIPELVEWLSNVDLQDPQGWTWNMSLRRLMLVNVKDMGWAQAELQPVLTAISNNKEDPNRRTAVSALGGMGEGARAVLERLTEDDDREVRRRAHSSLASLGDKKSYFRRQIEAHPLDPNVRSWLRELKGIVNTGQTHEPTQFVKARMRAHLSQHDDPDVSLRLAEIVSDQLRGTDLWTAAPSDRGRVGQRREDPQESFVTLSHVLSQGFSGAKEGSSEWKKLGRALVRTHLLLGEWDAMNQTLEQLGQPTLEFDRSAMSAPPQEWTVLAESWNEADESLLQGEGTIRVRVVKDGEGVRGAHLLVKKAKPPSTVFMTGLDADTILLEPLPVGGFFGGFGYAANDRAMTRYAVSDDSGVLSIDRLPPGSWKIELLVPAANFVEPYGAWDLYELRDDGRLEPLPSYKTTGIELKGGETFELPDVVVRPQFGINIKDRMSIADSSFELAWNDMGHGARYELKLSLTCPTRPEFVSADWIPRLEETITITEDARWPLGAKGVADLPLVPGNMYAIEVTAKDRYGVVLGRCPPTRFFVPWAHRESEGAWRTKTRDFPYDVYPLDHKMDHLQMHGLSDGRRVSLQDVVSEIDLDGHTMFEREYLELVDWWMRWHDGDKDGAARGLLELSSRLHEGNVVRETAVWLLKQLMRDEDPPRKFRFRKE